MAKYNYVDTEGLKHLIDKIKETYSTKTSADEIRQNLNTEVERATSRENDIEASVSSERERAEAVESSLSESVDNLSSHIDSLDSDRISDILVNGVSVVTDNIADIHIDEIQGSSIVVYSSYDTLPEVGDNGKLYVTIDDNKIYQWIGGEDRWKEIGGKDETLRAEFEQFKSDTEDSLSKKSDDGHKHDDLYYTKEESDSMLSDKSDTSHKHDELYYTKDDVYTKDEVDEIVQGGGGEGIGLEVLNKHNEAEDSHPYILDRIDEVNDSLSSKASLSIVSAHIANKENPHGVTKSQIGLENVDNTSDSDKPISTAVKTALELKADLEYVDNGLSDKLSASDISDNLHTSSAVKPLSANQGVILDGKIVEISSKVSSLGSALTFKGTVSSRDELPTSSSVGDSYQITDGADKGAMLAWNGESWVEIVASATDLSSMVATMADIYQIIDNYR